MARARNIKPSIYRNEILGTLDPLVTILFTSLWCLADRDGKLEDRPLRIKADTFPYRENIDINGYLTVLAQHGFIKRYSVAGVAIIQVCKFKEHQSPHNTEKASVLPDEQSQVIENKQESEVTVNPPLKDGEPTKAKRSDLLIPDSLIPECGKGASTKVPAMPKPVFVLPDWISKESWDGYVEMRKRIKKPMTDRAVDLKIKDLEAFKSQGHDITAILNKSASNNWTDLYAPKPEKPSAYTPPSPAITTPPRESVDPLMAKAIQKSMQTLRPVTEIYSEMRAAA